MSKAVSHEDEDDDSSVWKALKEHSKQKRTHNRSNSTAILTAHGIPFVVKNEGAHLIVTAGQKKINFWPGTGLWMVQGEPQRHGGVFKLLKYLKEDNANQINPVAGSSGS